METAAFLSDKAAAISVVEKQEFPFQKTLGPQVGGVVLKVRKTQRYPNSPVIQHHPGTAAWQRLATLLRAHM